MVGEALLRLEAVVLAARHGEGDSGTRLDVDVVTQGAQTVGIDENGVLLDINVGVKDRQSLVESAASQLGGQQVLLKLVTCLLQLQHFLLQSATPPGLENWF